MLACVDVHYGTERATAACVLFETWSAGAAARELVATSHGVGAYAPGEFYKRELPPLLALLGPLDVTLEAILVDGYVWLGRNRPGMGFHLHEALPRRTPVIGVAKSPFAGNTEALEVLRGHSQKPLFVSAVDYDPAEAASHLREMHGASRTPTLLRRVDALCRQSA